MTTTWYYILKFIAIISMVLDHIAITFAPQLNQETVLIFRILGRLAYPLFAYELVECFYYTKDKKKHMLILLLLALISELPFDMVFCFDKPFAFSTKAFIKQNVCLELLIGYVMIYLLEFEWEKYIERIGIKQHMRFIKFIIKVCIFGLAAYLALLLKADYTWHGIFLIFFFYFARRRKHKLLWTALALMIFVGSMGTSTPLYYSALFALIPIYMSIGRGAKAVFKPKARKIYKTMKLAGRYFYPLHLILLAITKQIVA